MLIMNIQCIYMQYDEIIKNIIKGLAFKDTKDKNLYIDLNTKLDFIVESLKYGTYNNYIIYNDILNNLKLNKLNIKLIILKPDIIL